MPTSDGSSAKVPSVGDDGLLSLKWNNHRSTFLHILTGLRDKPLHSDATLACSGELYPVHKLVLSSCSAYFASMFASTQCQHPIIVLKDIHKDELVALLDYMYVGEVDVKQSSLASLIKAAECLHIKGLAVPDEDLSAAPTSSATAGSLCHGGRKAKRGGSDSSGRWSPVTKRRRSSGSSDPSSSAAADGGGIRPMEGIVTRSQVQQKQQLKDQCNSSSVDTSNLKQSQTRSSSPATSDGCSSLLPSQMIKIEMEDCGSIAESQATASAAVAEAASDSQSPAQPREEEEVEDQEEGGGNKEGGEQWMVHKEELLDQEDEVEESSGVRQRLGSGDWDGSTACVTTTADAPHKEHSLAGAATVTVPSPSPQQQPELSQQPDQHPQAALPVACGGTENEGWDFMLNQVYQQMGYEHQIFKQPPDSGETAAADHLNVKNEGCINDGFDYTRRDSQYLGSESTAFASACQQVNQWVDSDNKSVYDSTASDAAVTGHHRNSKAITEIVDPDEVLAAQHNPEMYMKHTQQPHGRSTVSYSCPYCNKDFTDRFKWNRHLSAHTGEKPYVCEFCDKRYTRKDKLKSHCKAHHGRLVSN